MRAIEDIKIEDKKNKTLSMIIQMERHFAYLEFEYYVCLFLSGICLFIILGKLGWASGIGWLFFSKLIAKVITRAESMAIESYYLKSINDSPKIMFSHLN